MKKIKKRVFAAALAAALLFTMPGMTLAAVAKEAQTEDISESVTTQAEDDAAEEKTEAMQESESEEKKVPAQEDTEDTEQENTGERDDGTNFCAHHKEHMKDCGYSRASYDGEGSPCTYECRICPIKDLIVALPDWVTEDNVQTVRRQLDEILDLYRELTEEEQELLDLSPCRKLQEQLDEVNAPVTVDEPAAGDVARIEKPDGNTSYVSFLADAFAQENSGATITLLGDVELSTMMKINSGSFTLNLNGHMISNPNNVAIFPNNENVNLSICGIGNVQSGAGSAVYLTAGTLTLEGGTFFSKDETSCGVTAYSGTLKIAGSEVTVDRLGVGSGAQAVLSAGTYTGNPAIMASGSSATLGGLLEDNCAYYQNGSPIKREDLPGYDGTWYATVLSGPVTVEECTHPEVLKDQGDGIHGGDCPYCGIELAEEPHTLGVGNKCEGCGAELKVRVETSDGTSTYLGESDFAKAFDTYYNYDNVIVTLLSDIQPDNIDMGGVQARVHVFNTSTLDLAGHTITSSDTAIYVWPTGTLTIKDSSSGKTGRVVSTDGAAILTQTSMVSLMGGTYAGNPTIDGKSSSTDISSLLANYGTQTTPHYTYFDAQGNPIALEKNQRELTGTVTVKECKHTGVSFIPNNDGTHSLKCPYCGYTEAATICTYSTGYKHDENSHWQTCTVCGYEQVEAHRWEFVYEQTGNVTENFLACFDCRRTKDHLALTITVPTGLTYGNTESKKVTYTLSPEKTCDKVTWYFTDKGLPEFADGVLPADLPAGDHWFRVAGLMSDDTLVFTGAAYITVSPAPLTRDMVTLAPASAVYSGAEQKPAITVKQGKTTLTEGKDYDVTFSTTDFTNAGTVIITITGKGNYTGTVEKTYTINKAVLTENGTGIANGMYGAKLSELSVTGLTVISQGSTTEVPGTWKLAGSTVPDVGDTGIYTATFTPASGAGNYETLTAQVTLKIEKAAAPVPQAGILYVQNDKEQSYQYNLTQLLPALDNGKSYGTVGYMLKAVNFTAEGYYTEGAEIAGTTLTLPVQKVENNNVGDIGTVSITITSGNYKDMSATITVKSVNKAPVTITGASVAGREYNGKAIGCTGTPKAAESNGSTAAISSDDFQYTWQTADGAILSGAPKDAGSYLLIISVDNDEYIGSSTISFVIDKASITITANSMTVGKGSAKPALTYTISGLAEGEELAAEPTLTCNADMNTVGRYPITINGAEVPATGNYRTEITYVPGTLTVTVRTSGGSSSVNNNGNSSGSENSGDGGQGSSGDNGGGNITLGVPAVSTVADTNPETDTETMKPGAGNTARPGKRTEPESGTAKDERPDAGIPFIKEEVGKIGWNVIREEEEKAEEGSIINVDMNGTTIVPGDIFDSIEGRDITITFDMGNGIIWSVDGKSIMRDASRDKADDIDFTVITGGNAVPMNIVNSVTGEHYSIQLSLAHNGEFGFSAVLSINLGKENAGYIASLYYYNEDIGELEFICADEVAQDGTVSIAFTHASDYVIVVDRKVEESDGAAEEAQPEEADENGTVVPESPKTIQEKKNVIWPIVAGIIALAGIVVAGVVVWRKKEGNKSFKEKDK